MHRMLLVVGQRSRSLAARAGQGLVEYALIIVLIAIAVIVALMALSGQLQTVFNRITSSLQ